MSSKKVSLADIASSLGISKSTVSFVLNDKGDQYNISPETQRAIREKAKELNYVPNFFAKSLREGKTKTVGLVVPDITKPLYAGLSKIIQQELFTKGYNVFIVNTNDDPNLEIELVEELINRSIDGMIIVHCNEVAPLQPLLDNTPIPVVFMDRIADEFGDFVGIDYYKEAYDLVGKFSQRPAKLAIVHHGTNVHSVQARIQGVSDAATKAGISFEVLTSRELVKANPIQAGYDAILTIDATATFQSLDMIQAYKIQVPSELKVLSFEDDGAFAYTQPGISALRQPIHEIGMHTVAQLMKRLEAEQQRGHHLYLACVFNERNSH